MPFLHPPYSGNHKRIISVVPSQTELLYSLGLDEEVIGITKFCVHPDSWFKNKTRVGGTKNLKLELIRKLQPDLILTNKEENTQEEIETLSKEFNVYVSDISDLEGALKMITDIGTLTNKLSESKVLVNEIHQSFNQLPITKPPFRVAYLIWQEPFITIGRDTFIHDMMERCGFENVFKHLNRYPEISIADLQSSKIELVLLSSEPYPFKEIHKKKIEEHLIGVKCILVDGEFFSWYGSRMLIAPQYFKDLQIEIQEL